MCTTVSLFAQYEPGQLFFKFETNTSVVDVDAFEEQFETDQTNRFFTELKRKYPIQSITCPFQTKDPIIQHTFLLEVADDYVDELITKFEALSYIEYAERVPKMELFLTPNDPFYAQQYNLSITDADLAWDLSVCPNGSNQTVVAVIDDAVLLSHPDLVPVIWTNPNEIPGNGIDDDNNGYIDDVNGWDAANNDNNPNPPANASSSFFSHGTHVAGIVGAATDNNQGIASIGFGLQLMAVKIGNSSSGSLSGAWAGVDYTIASGYVDIANMSWGGGSYSFTYQNLLNVGYNQGITWVAAAGNSNTSAPMYPAAYQNVISVAATNSLDQRASFSNYGNTIDVSAPGVSILSTVPGAGLYANKSGTSMASPFVAGLAGLIKCYSPGATPLEIENCLESTAENINAQNPAFINQLGTGRVNALSALECFQTSPVAAFSASPTTACPNQTIQFNDESLGAAPLSYAWSFPGGTPATSTLSNPSVTYANTGTYTVNLTVSNSFGNDILSNTNYITIANPTVSISGNASIVQGGIGFLRVDFTGNPPFNISYTDGVNNYTENGITNNPYFIQVSPSDTTTYSLLSMNDVACAGSATGTATINVLATPNNASGECFFANVYGDNLNNEIKDVYYDKLNDVFYACGSHVSNGWVMKLNGQGDILWTREYPAINNFHGIELLANGTGLLLIGEVGPASNSDVHMTRITTDGIVEWSKSYNSGFSDRLIPRKTTKTLFYPSTSPNAYNVLVAVSPVFPYDHAVIINFDINTGAINSASKWANNTGTNSTSENAPYNYIFDDDGNVAFVGPYTDLSNGGNFVRIDPVNNTLIAAIRLAGSSNDSRLFKVAQLDNGNYVISGIHRFGSGSYYPFITCIDKTTNNVLWTRRIQQVLSFNNFVTTTAGNSIFSIINGDILVKLDNNGNLITSLLIADTEDARIEDEEDFLVLFDFSNYPQGYGQDDNLIAKLDTALTSCLFSPFPLNVTNENINVNTVTKFSSTISFTETNLSTASNVLMYMDTAVCPVNCDSTISNNPLLCWYVDTVQKISDISGNFSGILSNDDRFGRSVDNIGDFNGDGVTDLVVGVPYEDDGSTDAGAIYILIMNSDGTVNNEIKISNTMGNFSGGFQGLAGIAVTQIGDLDNNGVVDLAVGASQDDDGGTNVGAVWILFLDATGNVINSNKLSATTGASMLGLGADDRFGVAIENLGDINGDGVTDLLVGASQDDDGGSDRGAAYILNLSSTGSINSFHKISSTSAYFTGQLDNADNFGLSCAVLNDINGDGFKEVVVGASNDDDGGVNAGAAYILYLNAVGTPNGFSKISNAQGFPIPINANDGFGVGLEGLGDLNQDGIEDLLMGSYLKDDGGTNVGAFHICLLNPNGTVLDIFKINNASHPDLTIGSADLFASSLVNIGDLDNNGLIDFVASAHNGDDGGTNRGEIYVIFMEDSCNIDPPIEIVCSNNLRVDTMMCLGDSLQLTAQGDSNIIWLPNYAISNNTIKNPFVFPTQDTSYIVVSTDTLGCQYADTFHVVVNPLPDVVASPDSSTVCPASGVNLNVSGAASYNWSPTIGLSNPSSSNPTANPVTSTLYIVSGTDVNGCSNTDSVYLNVLSCCGAYAAIGASDTMICVNESINFSNLSVSGGNPSWSWNFGPGAVPANFNGQFPPSVSFSSPGVNQVELILADACGTDTVRMNIYVYDLPIFDVANDTSFCGSDTLLYELGDLEVIGYDYQWTPSTGLNDSSLSNPIATVSSSITYQVTVIDQFTSCVAQDSVVINVTQLNDTLIAGQSGVCEGDSVTLYVHQPYDSVRWNGSLLGDTISFTPSNDTLIYVDVYLEQCIVRDSFTVAVDTLPVYTVQHPDSLCEGSEWQVQVNTSSLVYWMGADTTSSFNTTIIGDTTLYFSVINGACQTDDSISVTALALPEDTLFGPDSVCVNTSVNINTTGMNNYVWSNGDTTVSSNYTITQDTVIQVEILNGFCSVLDSLVIIALDSTKVEIIGDTLVCEGDSFELNALSNAIDLLWQDGTVGPTISGTLNSDSLFTVIASGDFCPNDTASVFLEVETSPVVDVISPISGFYGDQLSPVVNGSAQLWNWLPPTGLSCADCQSPVVTVDSTLIYIVEAFNGDCIARDTLEIQLIELDGCYLLPTGFSPNGDLINDTFFPVALPAPDGEILSFKIYNRWGELIHDAPRPWDGRFKNKEQPLDVYVFILESTCYGEVVVQSGNVTLIR